MTSETDMSLFSPPTTEVEHRPDGALVLRSRQSLSAYPDTVLHSFRSWALEDPEHVLIAERENGGSWRTLSYGDAVRQVDAIAEGLLQRGIHGPGPILILSGNSVDHLLMMLGAMTAGIPAAPVSVAYSLQSRDHARLQAIAGIVSPSAVFVEDLEKFRPAVASLSPMPVIVGTASQGAADMSLADLMSTPPGPKVERAFADLAPESLAKVLFTSGSTGEPKGVLNTHRMLSANQQMMRQAWPFLTRERPVIVDWLPWSHTFGGNHNLNMILTNGGSLFVDDGRPTPQLFETSIRNLSEVPPTIYFNVPAGFAQLVPALEADELFATRFFSRVRLMFNAAAPLPDPLRERLAQVARRTVRRSIPITGSWGATETGPAVTTANFKFSDARCIGAPLPGSEVKLVPIEDGYEIRVRGPMVTPGYFGRPDLNSVAFDHEDFYRPEDTVVLTDPGDPDAGLVFHRRTIEDFKLATGTFVRVGVVRTGLLSASPLIADAIITGEDREFVGALVWLNTAEVRGLLPNGLPEGGGELVVDDLTNDVLSKAVRERNIGAGSSRGRAVSGHDPAARPRCWRDH